MGMVYKVFDTKIQEKIAVKIIQPEIAGDLRTIGRFRNELKLARQITHRNVCRMYDLGENEGAHFITMEYVSGKNLKSIIRMMGPLTIGPAMDYARQICEGLGEAHRLGVVHRDLKSQNIMIDESGMVKIMDFGIARSIKAGGQTGDGALIGTPNYMSPEQVEGKTADQRSDLYSFGVILYEMVAGDVPFHGDTPISVALKHKTEMPRPPEELNAQIPGDLNKLILKCLEKDKNNRFQNAAELLPELKRIEEHLPQAIPPAAGKRAKTTTMLGRIKGWPTAGIGILILAIATAGYFLLQKKPSSRTSLGESPKLSAPMNAIVILTIKDLSQEQNRNIFCEGLTDNIRTKLSEIGDMKVIPKNSSDRFKNKDIDIKEIGRFLNIQKVLTGTLQTRKDKIWVNLNLSDAQSGFNEWSKSYDVNEDIQFQIEDQIINDIADHAKVRVNMAAFQHIKKKEPVDYRAFKNIQEGKLFETKYRDSRLDADFSQALKIYQSAANIDPNYALAYYSLGNLYEARYALKDRADDLLAMLGCYRRAYEADPTMAEAYVGLGWAYFFGEDFDHAYDSFKTALDINPHNTNAIEGAGAFLRSIGLYKPAIKYFVQLTALDPLYASAHLQMAGCHWSLGEYEQALQILQRVKAFDPENTRLHIIYLARQYLSVNRYNEAEKELAWAEKIKPLSESLRQNFMRNQIWLYAAEGERNKALALIQQVDRPFAYEITNAYCLLGMKDKAIQNIYEGINRGFQVVKDVMYAYPLLISNRLYESLRSDPRFTELLSQEKEKYDRKLKAYQGLF